jgi:hypothetical protein
MFKSFSNSWELFQATLTVLRQDKELVIFPIISGIGVTLVMIVFAIPAFFTFSSDNGALQAAGYVVVFLFYFVTYFIVIFANSALVGAALIRLRGGDPTLGDGFRIALSRLGPILGYTAIAATVGMILHLLESSFRSGRNRGGAGLVGSIIGGIIVALVGAAWSIATYLVVPILVVEGTGPIQSLKQSIALLKKTWGEQIAGQIGIGWAMALFYLAAILIGGLGIALGVAIDSAILVVVFVAFLILAFVILALISSALSGIYSAAVYRYAAEGQIAPQFPRELILNTFRTK